MTESPIESQDTLLEKGFELSTERHVFMNGFTFPRYPIRFCWIFFAECINAHWESVWCNEQWETLSHKIFWNVRSLAHFNDWKVHIDFGDIFLDIGFLSFKEDWELLSEIVEHKGETYIYKDMKYVKCGHVMDFGDQLVSMKDGVIFAGIWKHETWEIVHHQTDNVYTEPDSVNIWGTRYFFNLDTIRKQRNPNRARYVDEVVSSRNNLRIQLWLKVDIQSVDVKKWRDGLYALSCITESWDEIYFLVTEEWNRVKILNSDNWFYWVKKLSDCEILWPNWEIIWTMYIEYDMAGDSNILTHDWELVTKVSNINSNIPWRFDRYYGASKLQLQSGRELIVCPDFSPFIIEGREVSDLKYISGSEQNWIWLVVTFACWDKKFYYDYRNFFTDAYQASQKVSWEVRELV